MGLNMLVYCTSFQYYVNKAIIRGMSSISILENAVIAGTHLILLSHYVHHSTSYSIVLITNESKREHFNIKIYYLYFITLEFTLCSFYG